jgi:glycosyltransferase involved in cell wall biosynthesis
MRDLSSDMKNTFPEISIGVVVYNGVEHIGSVLDSIVGQSYRNIELIVVDGDSNDGTQNVLNEYAQHISVLVCEPDKGIYDAMNKVCSLATGDWLIFLGCDDVLLDALGRIAEQMSDPDSIYYGDVVFRSSGNIYGGVFSKQRLAQMNFCHQAVFYPRSVYKKYSYGLEYRWLADYAYNIKLVGVGIPFGYVAEVVSVFNDKGGSSFGDAEFEKEKLDLIRSSLGTTYALFEILRRQKERLVNNAVLLRFTNRLYRFIPQPVRNILRPYVWKILRTQLISQVVLKLSGLGDSNSFESDIGAISKSDLIRLDYYCPPYLQGMNREEAIWMYVWLWAIGVGRRKLFPGFHPGIYLEQHGVERVGVDPLADYLRAGQPQGPWNFELITSEEEAKPFSPRIRIGLHIHAYYLDLFPEILDRLRQNHVRPDLLISVTSESARLAIAAHLETYEGGAVDIRVVPNRGRDIGPLLTEFGETIRQKYDLIGHLHTKKSPHIKEESINRGWNQFLLENLLGGQAPMADIILGRMADDQDVMMVFPDDPNVLGWGGNFCIGEKLLSSLGIKYSFRELCFPIGTMFWARTAGLKALLDLNLHWEDYPEEPLAYDGSSLHALERVFGILATYSGGSILQTNVSGSTR